MTTMMRAITLLLDRRAQAAVAVLAALVASLLLGPGEVAAGRIKGHG